MNNMKSLQDRINEQADAEVLNETNEAFKKARGMVSSHLWDSAREKAIKQWIAEHPQASLGAILDMFKEEVIKARLNEAREEKTKKFLDRVDSLQDQIDELKSISG